MNFVIMSLDLKKIKYNHLGFFRFKEFKNKYILTNDVGQYLFLTKKEFLQETKNMPFYGVIPNKKLEQFYQNIDTPKLSILKQYQELTIISNN